MNIIEEIKKRNIKPIGLIHVGAHTCLEYESYINLSVDNIILFEPIDEIFSELGENVNRILSNNKRNKYPNTVLTKKGLGSEICKKEMWVENTNPWGGGMSSSLLEPKRHTEHYPDIIFDKKIEIEVSTLDEELKDNENKYNILNVDVQGYELEVLKGSVKVLENIDIIFIEVNAVEMYKDCVLIDELDDFLKLHGFIREETIWQYHNGEKTWGDAIYVSNINYDGRLSNLEKYGEIKSFKLMEKKIFKTLKNLNYNPKIIYDIGASGGWWSSATNEIFPNSTYYLFEPLVDHSEEYSIPMYKHTENFKNFKLFKVALGKETESKIIKLFTDSIYSSTILNCGYENSIEIPVECWKLDDLIETKSLLIPNVIKIDTQGSELEILKGMERNIKYVDFLIIETWLLRGYGEETPLINEIIEWLNNFGFKLFDFGTEYRDGGVLKSIDCVFINTNKKLF
jgi:FkbM family methyltransferase